MNEPATSRQDRLILWLFLFVTALTVGGGIAAWTASGLHQRRIVAALTGGETRNRVGYDYEGEDSLRRRPANPPGPAWLRDWLGIDFFSSVAWAHISTSGEGVIEQLASLRGLRHLDFSGIDFNGQHGEFDLEPLGDLPDLEELSVENLTLLGDGLAVLIRLPKLRSLRLSNGENVDDKQFESVARLASLKRIQVYGCDQLTDAGLAKIGRLKTLESLTLMTSRPTTDGVLERLTALDHLHDLALDYGYGLQTTGGLRHLSGFTHLEKLNLYRVSDEGLAAVGSAPTVKDLNLAGSGDPGQWLGEPGLRNIGAFSNVERLTLWELPALNDRALAHLAKLPKLRELTISSKLTTSALSDAGIAQLAGLTQLEKVQLTVTTPSAVSLEGIERLRQQRPACEIRFETK